MRRGRNEERVEMADRLRRLRVSRETRRVVLLTCGQLGLAVGIWVLFVHDAVPPMSQPRISWWLLAPAFALAELCLFEIVVRRQSQSVILTELPLVIALFFATPADLVVGRLLSAGVLLLVHRQAALKAFYNVSLMALETIVALLFFHSVLLTGLPDLFGDEVTLRGWVAMSIAVAGSALISGLSVALVISFYEGRPKLSEFGALVLSAPPMSMVVGTIGMTGVYCLGADPVSAIPLLVTLGVVLGGYRVYGQLRERHLNLERIYQFSQAVTSTPEMDDVLHNVLDRAREMLVAETVTVLFASNDGSHVCVTINAANRLERADGTFNLDDWVWRQVLADSPVVLPRSIVQDPVTRAWLDAVGLREALVVPLHGDTGVLGAIMVGDRHASVHAYDQADVALLESVAAHATIALQNGRLVDQLRHDSLHDALTGLPNRLHLQRRLLEALRPMDNAGTEFAEPAVLVMDLNGFKNVNDTMGHQSGDILLQEVALRMRAAAPEDVLVARLGGDEFAILIPTGGTAEEVTRIAHVILGTLDQPIPINEIDVEVGASIGAAIAPRDGLDSATLLKHADLAMYIAKSEGGGVRLYDGTAEATQPHRQVLVEALRLGIACGQLRLEVQPQVRLGDGAAVAAEVLVRWEHPSLGLLGPEEFLPLAERSGLIRPLTDWILAAALEACAGWRADGYDVGVSINISQRNLHHRDFPAQVQEELQRSGVPAGLLTLELTEHAIMADPDRSLTRLIELKKLGLRLSLDDFGTGYSSLSKLNQLPVDELKIDHTFVAALRADRVGDVVVRSIAQLGRNLGLLVVAEGIEDAATARALAGMGVQAGQGYYFAGPMTPSDFEVWMESHGARPIDRGTARAASA